MLLESQLPIDDLRRRQRRRPWRRGTAVVKFAVVAPLLFSVVLAILEFGRGMMVAENLGGGLLADSAVSGTSSTTRKGALVQ
jgi:Flp pilus assembly protein TadG